MGIKKIPTAVLCLFSALAVGAQTKSTSVSALCGDFTTFIQSIGGEIAPNLHSTALSAQCLGAEPVRKLSFAVEYGSSLSDGLGKILAPEATSWSFAEPFNSIVDQAATGISDQLPNDIDSARNSYAYSAFKIGVGVPLPDEYDLILDGFFLPQALTSWALDNYLPSYLSGLSVGYSVISIDAKVRKLLVHDEGLLPAVTVGVGAVYSYANASFSTSSLASLAHTTINAAGGCNVDFSGSCDLSTSVAGGGVEVVASKRFIAMTPFVKASLYYCSSGFFAKPNVVATVTQSDGSTQSQSITAPVSVWSSGLDFQVTGGIDVHLWNLILSGSATIEPTSFSMENSSGSLSLNGLSLNFGLIYTL